MKRSRKSTQSSAESRVPRSPLASHAGIVRFAVLFTILVSLGSASELFLLRGRHGERYQHLIAEVIGRGLRFADIPARIVDTTIHINDSSVDVAIECTGIKATAIFCAGVLAFPCAWRVRAAGMVTGLLGVALLNVMRITALALVAGYQGEWFDRIHAVLMQGFLILFVAPLWIGWMVLANRPGMDHGPATRPNRATASSSPAADD